MQKLYVLTDKVAKLSGNPMVFNTKEEAERYFEEVVKREGTIPYARPADFEWRCVGEFSRETGEIHV